MKKILTIVWLAIIAGACSLNDSLNLNEGNGKIIEKESFSSGGASAMSISPGLKYYFKASNGSSIYRSNVSTPFNCNSFSESVGVLGNGALSPYGPSATIFNNKIYLFHKGNTNNYIYYSTSTDGISWSTDNQLGNGAASIGTVSSTVHNNKIFVAHSESSGGKYTNIYVSVSSNGTSWGSEYVISWALNWYNSDPWIFSKDGKLFICYARQNPNGSIGRRIIYSNDDGQNWGVWSDAVPTVGAFQPASQGFSIAVDPVTGKACMIYVDNTYLKVSYSTNNLVNWTVPVNLKAYSSGVNAQSGERPVVTWDSSCGRFFSVHKGYANNSIYKSYPDINGILWEQGSLIGTTTHGPYVISN